MPWIKTISEEEASDDLEAIYSGLKANRGKVSNIMSVQSLNPRAMKSHMDLYMAMMFGSSGISREERELLATAISIKNGCEYCRNHHGEALNKYWKDDERLRTFINDFGSADLSQRAKVMIDYATKLTRHPEDMREDDIRPLRDNDFSDEDILNINLITAYFNFVNRVAVGLGVESSEEEMRGYKV